MTRRTGLILFGVLGVAQLGLCALLIGRWELTLRRGAAFRFLAEPVDPYDAFRGRYVAIRLERDYIDVPESADLPAFTVGQTAYATLAEGADGYAHFDRLLAEPPAGAQPYLRTKVLRMDEQPALQPRDILAADALARCVLHSNDVVSVVLREHLEPYERTALEQGLAGEPGANALNATLAGLLERALTERTVAARLVNLPDAVNSYDLYEQRPRLRLALVKAFPGLLAPPPAVRVILLHPFTRFYMPEPLAPRAEQAYRQHSGSGRTDRTTISVRIHRGWGVIENLWIGAQTMSDHLKTTAADP